MSYLELAVWVLAAAVLVGVVLQLLTRRRNGAPAHLGAIAMTIATLVVLTAVFDSLMIAADLFYYAPEMLVGAYIGLAPIEDFSYPLAGAVLLPCLWALLRSCSRPETSSAQEQQRP